MCWHIEGSHGRLGAFRRWRRIVFESPFVESIRGGVHD